MDEKSVAPHVRSGMYVRAIVLCGAIEARSDGMKDIRGVVTHLELPRDSPGIRVELQAFLAIERNGDAGTHTLRLLVIDPNDREVNWSDPMQIPAGPTGTLTISSTVLLQTVKLVSGRWRVLVELDGRVTGFAPIDIDFVDPATLGLPEQRSH